MFQVRANENCAHPIASVNRLISYPAEIFAKGAVPGSHVPAKSQNFGSQKIVGRSLPRGSGIGVDFPFWIWNIRHCALCKNFCWITYQAIDAGYWVCTIFICADLKHNTPSFPPPPTRGQATAGINCRKAANTAAAKAASIVIPAQAGIN